MIFCRKILFFGFFIFLFSFSPNLSFADGVSTANTTPAQYVKVTEDTDIHITDQQIVGVLHAGTQVGVQNNQDGKIYFQWDGTSAYIDNSNPILGLGSDNLSFSWVDSGNSGTENRFRTHNSVNVYSDTNLNNPILTLNSDVEYPITQNNGEYYEITIGQRTGLVKATDVELISENSTVQPTSNTTQLAATNQAATSNTQTNTTSSTDNLSVSENSASVTLFSSSVGYFKVTSDEVAIYDSSSDSSKLLGYLFKDQVYQKIADNGDWYQIKLGNGLGYIRKVSTVQADGITLKNLNSGQESSGQDFTSNTTLTVYDNSSGSLVPFANLAQGVQYPYISDIGDWLQVDVGGRIGYVYKPVTSKGFLPSDRYFQVDQDNVSIYDNSSGSLNFVGSLVKGQIYTRVSGYGSDWQQITFGNGYGYVWTGSTVPSAGNILKDLNPGLANSGRYFTANTILTVYDNSSGSLVPFANLAKGVQYPLISDTGDWLLVDVAGRVGNVYKPAAPETFLPSDRYFQVNQDSVTVYDNSSGSLQVAGHLQKGEIYPRIADYGIGWHQIKFGNGYGYVWKDATTPANGNIIKDLNTNLQNSNILFVPNQDIAVYDNTSGSLVPFASLVQGKSYPAISNFGSDWYEVDVSGRIGYVYKAGTTRIFSAGDKYFQVTNQNIPVYDNSSGSLVVVGYLNSGQVYPRVSDYGDWHQIKFGDRYGYVWKASTVVADNSTLKNEDTSPNSNKFTFKSLQDLTVYDNTSGSLVPFGVINQGRLYPAISKIGTGDWLKIDFSGRIGYVYAGAALITSGGLIADLSEWQGTVDFSQLAKVVDGVILRVQSGSTHPDVKYQEYVAGCKANNIPFGTYGYFNASDTAAAIAEAQSAYQLMDKSSQFFAVDIEKLTGADLVSAGQAYIDYLKQQGIAKVGLYSGDYFFKANNLGAIKCDFYWIANYGPNNGQENKYPSSPNDLWQFTSVGALPGIKGNVDESAATSKQLIYFTGNS